MPSPGSCEARVSRSSGSHEVDPVSPLPAVARSLQPTASNLLAGRAREGAQGRVLFGRLIGRMAAYTGTAPRRWWSSRRPRGGPHPDTAKGATTSRAHAVALMNLGEAVTGWRCWSACPTTPAASSPAWRWTTSRRRGPITGECFCGPAAHQREDQVRGGGGASRQVGRGGGRSRPTGSSARSDRPRNGSRRPPLQTSRSNGAQERRAVRRALRRVARGQCREKRQPEFLDFDVGPARSSPGRTAPPSVGGSGRAAYARRARCARLPGCCRWRFELQTGVDLTMLPPLISRVNDRTYVYTSPGLRSAWGFASATTRRLRREALLDGNLRPRTSAFNVFDVGAVRPDAAKRWATSASSSGALHRSPFARAELLFESQPRTAPPSAWWWGDDVVGVWARRAGGGHPTRRAVGRRRGEQARHRPTNPDTDGDGLSDGLEAHRD